MPTSVVAMSYVDAAPHQPSSSSIIALLGSVTDADYRTVTHMRTGAKRPEKPHPPGVTAVTAKETPLAFRQSAGITQRLLWSPKFRNSGKNLKARAWGTACVMFCWGAR